MRKKNTLKFVLVLASAQLLVVTGAYALTPLEELGKSLFFDENLSLNSNQSCATCHAPEAGWTGPDSTINNGGSVYEGSIPGAFGDRKPPTAAYAGDSPVLYYNARAGAWVGGMFWDGRAAGWRLGDPLAEQAQGPFLNPKEQALSSLSDVVTKVQISAYKDLFAEQCPGTDPAELYDCIGRAIAAFERSSEVSPFTSKYDYWLKGKAKLTAQEHLGRALFQGKAKCSACHIMKGKQPLFTDFTYDNLGIPKNPENPATIADPTWADPGLGGFLRSLYPDQEEIYAVEMGKHKVPTLRNVDLRTVGGTDITKAYGHNGYFKSLEEIVHFYNTRDVPGAGWPEPEVAENVNTAEMGNLGLSPREEAAVVAFMKTLSDGYQPKVGK